MDINDLTMGQIKEIQAMTHEPPGMAVDIPFIGLHCLIRTFSAGVHVGILKEHRGAVVRLENSRRIWRWSGAFTCSELARRGLDPTDSRMSVLVPDHVLTEAIEILPTTPKARGTFDECNE